jgi:hypothetical protein
LRASPALSVEEFAELHALNVHAMNAAEIRGSL